MRVEAGAVVDEFELPGIGQVVARHTRTKTPDGGVTWACIFTVAAPGTSDLAVVHRLSAPSLAEGRRSVRQAVEFLAGRSMHLADEPPQPAAHPGALPPTTNRPHRRETHLRLRDRQLDPDHGRIPDFSAAFGRRPPRIPVFDLPAGDHTDHTDRTGHPAQPAHPVHPAHPDGSASPSGADSLDQEPAPLS